MSHSVNPVGVNEAGAPFDPRQCLLAEVQPSTSHEDDHLEPHEGDECLAGHLGSTVGVPEHIKVRHVAVNGDSRWVHRSGLIAARHRVPQWRQQEVELAAHDLLQHLDHVST